MKTINIVLSALVFLAFCSCKENDIALYDQPARIEFGGNTTHVFDDEDYLNAYILGTEAYSDVEITSRLIGYLLDSPMSYCLKAGKVGLTAFHPEVKFESQYLFPADTAECKSIVKVKCPEKTSVSTQDNVYYGQVDILYDTENTAHQFGEGRIENKAARISVALQIYPVEWDYVFWGTYSTSKYILIMETFRKTHVGIEPTIENKMEILKAYRKYKEEHGPLYGDGDESGNEIQFPA